MSNNELIDNAPMNISDTSSQTTTAKFNTDLKSHKNFGMLLFILLFGFGGIWAATAPIDGAAYGGGKVTARSYSKIVQHLEGGIISNIFVENGARVAKGDPILDIDNTPDDLITSGNARLYSQSFLAKIKHVLTPNGCVAYWLSEPAPKFKKCLIKAGFQVEEHAAKPHEKSKRARHCIYVARSSK